MPTSHPRNTSNDVSPLKVIDCRRRYSSYIVLKAYSERSKSNDVSNNILDMLFDILPIDSFGNASSPDQKKYVLGSALLHFIQAANLRKMSIFIYVNSKNEESLVQHGGNQITEGNEAIIISKETIDNDSEENIDVTIDQLNGTKEKIDSGIGSNFDVTMDELNVISPIAYEDKVEINVKQSECVQLDFANI